MKILSIDFLSNFKAINYNLNKYIPNIKILLDDYLTLDNETIILYINDISLGLLNALRQIAYKYDYIYHLDVHIDNIYINNNIENNINNDFINKTEISNRINSIIIDNNFENKLYKYTDNNIGYIKKKINYYNESQYEYIKTNDIIFYESDLIILDKHINICMLPYISGEFNIKNIKLKKSYTNEDSRYCNINTFIIIPLNDDNKNISNDYNFNNIYNNYKVQITSIGCLSADKLLPRFLNILYIKLLNKYINELENESYILFLQSGIYLENLLIEYSYNNNIDIICKNVDNNLYCYNISIDEINKIINLIKNDIITFISLLLKINNNDAEDKLINRYFAKYF